MSGGKVAALLRSAKRRRLRTKGYKPYNGKERIVDLDKIIMLLILLLSGVTVAVQVFYK